jgi:hypothetical protein
MKYWVRYGDGSEFGYKYNMIIDIYPLLWEDEAQREDKYIYLIDWKEIPDEVANKLANINISPSNRK